jgi:hypothetical protein
MAQGHTVGAECSCGAEGYGLSSFNHPVDVQHPLLPVVISLSTRIRNVAIRVGHFLKCGLLSTFGIVYSVKLFLRKPG